MRKDWAKYLLVIVISFGFLLIPAYHSYTILLEIDLFPTDPNLETDDQPDVEDDESDTFSSMIPSLELGVNRFEQSHHDLPRIFFDCQTSILRC